MEHKSSSREQLLVGELIYRKIALELNVPDLMENPHLPIEQSTSTYIVPDFFSMSQKIIGEIHTHVGKLKPAQFHKIAADILKMLLFEKSRNETYHKILVVCSDEEAKQLMGNSYIAEAIRQFDIQIKIVTLSPTEYEILSNAQKRQRMINA